MQQTLVRAAVTVLAAFLIGGCATSTRQLMPTPTLLEQSRLFQRTREVNQKHEGYSAFLVYRRQTRANSY